MNRLANWKPIVLGALLMVAIEIVATPTRVVKSQDVSTMPQPVERASPDDCAIIVEVGKYKMNWGATAPDAVFYPEF